MLLNSETLNILKFLCIYYFTIYHKFYLILLNIVFQILYKVINLFKNR